MVDIGKPVFKNIFSESLIVLSTPAGTSVTVHPGDCVSGEYFRSQSLRLGMVEVTPEVRETISLKSVKYVSQ